MHWTEAEYLAFEELSPTKHEYFDGEIFAMAGAGPSHNLVAGSALSGLGALTKRGRCRVFTSDQRIYVPPTGLYTYADGGLVCGQMRIHTDRMCLLNPTLLIEVLSPSTREYDTGAKREHYQQIPSLRHILFIDQPARHVRHYHRSEGGVWELSEAQSGALALPDLGGSLMLDDLYAALD